MNEEEIMSVLNAMQSFNKTNNVEEFNQKVSQWNENAKELALKLFVLTESYCRGIKG